MPDVDEDDLSMPDSPVAGADPQPLADLSDPSAPADGLGLCLSGGGYRAMLFHVGVVWRLREVGLLGRLDRISSVSGGSITAALLGLRFDAVVSGSRDGFLSAFVGPLRELAGETLDAEAILGGLLLPGTIADRVAAGYRKHVFGDATLQDLPDGPRFVLNATNVQSGALFRFSKPYLRDWRVGEIRNPEVPLASAVAASSAFPPVLSPFILKVDPSTFTPGSGKDLQTSPYTKRIVLSDGGVYDNLGLETIWKRCRTVFVSDAGGKLRPEPDPKSDWARHAVRVSGIVDDQVRNLRKRQLIRAFKAGHRPGAYWGIRTPVAAYELPDALDCPEARTRELAGIPTRLAYLPDETQERLINWGYAACDASLRKHFDGGFPKPQGFPYSRGV